MLHLSALVAFALAGTALAADTVYVYPIMTAKKLSASTTEFVTPNGFSVYVDCDRLIFDDPTHDRVSGFSNRTECERFVSEAKKAKKAEIELRNIELTLRVLQ